MKLDLSFEQNQLNISVPFIENAGKFNANFGETSVIHDGQNGATFIPSVSTEGVISWTNDRDLPNPEPVNIKGEKGDTPMKGVDYFTDADKQELVQDVLNALPNAEEGNF